MANEYLKRQPTSTGNRRSFSISFWMKNSDTTQGYTAIIGAGKLSPSNVYNEIFYNNGAIGLNLDNASDPENYTVNVDQKNRDPSSWMHVLLTFDDSKSTESEKAIFYINGNRVAYSAGASTIVNEGTFFNNADYIHYIGSRAQQNAGSVTFDGQFFDAFMVDGQTLTPEVFGFHKDGYGSVSVGSTTTNDFRNGQWVPRNPREIKNSINATGGFGVNGFYLPMNDSSNFGADFHTTPNSIIKLKGENLPQPRNGAPDTTDAYVSQLRQEEGTLGFDGVVKFDGSGDYLSIPSSSDFALGTGDWTIEYFAYSTSTAQYQRHFYLIGSNANQIEGIFADSNGISFGKTGVWAPTQVGHTINRWNHYALVHDSTNMRLYINGNQVLTSTDNFANENKSLHIGYSNSTFGGYFTGFMSNFRVVKGTALYTSNFTSPTEPLTNVTNTKLLCCNSSTSATASTVTPGTITANGDVYASRNELTGSIVLAVPGISTSTSANLVTNGHFDISISGWSSFSDATLSVESGGLKVQCTGGDTVSAGSYNFTTVIGQRYTVTVEVVSRTGTTELGISATNIVGGSATILSTNNDHASLSLGFNSRSFTATSTTTYIGLWTTGSNSNAVFDNVIVKQEDAPRDYSADIKGSGSNKILTAVGNAGVGYEIPSYYGSVMQFSNDGTNGSGNADVINIPTSSDFVFTNNWTMECWLYPKAAPTVAAAVVGQWQSGGGTNRNIELVFNTSRQLLCYLNSNGSNYNTGTSPALELNQWHHAAVVYSGTDFTLYLNGVRVGIRPSTPAATNVPTIPFLIGSESDGSNGADYGFDGLIQDVRVYKGVAKYKGGFDIPKPFTPVGIESWRQLPVSCKDKFATLTNLSKTPTVMSGGRGTIALSEANLTSEVNSTTGDNKEVIGNISVRSGKWYYEATFEPGGTAGNAGNSDAAGWVCDHGFGYNGTTAGGFCILARDNGSTVIGNASSRHDDAQNTFERFNTGDVLGCAIDLETRVASYYLNGNLYEFSHNFSGRSDLDDQDFSPFILNRTQPGTVRVNFGQNPTFSGAFTTAGTYTDSNGKGLFKYQPPEGFLALCGSNLETPIDDPSKHFQTVVYDGTALVGNKITGLKFKPDFVWIKSRQGGVNNSWHSLNDSVRDARLWSNDAAAEDTFRDVMSYDDNGFSVNYGSYVNNGGGSYVAWCWKGGGDAVKNNDGTIESRISANPTAGFSIVTWTGDGVNNRTIGHGLGKRPSIILTKRRNTSQSWYVWVDDLTETTVNNGMTLNTTAVVTTFSYGHFTSLNDTTMTLTSGASNITNLNGRSDTYVAYCWSEIEGYSKIGTYTGNGNADGPFVYCGFKPAFLMIKITSPTGQERDWHIYDSTREPTNPLGYNLRPSASVEEQNEPGFDFLSNGFKVRSNYTFSNHNTGTFMFMAFAESPFKYANAK